MPGIINHDGMVFYSVMFLKSPVFISVKRLIVGWARRAMASASIALLCWSVQRSFMCLFVPHDSSWRQLSFYFGGHMLHIGEMSCLRKCF